MKAERWAALSRALMVTALALLSAARPSVADDEAMQRAEWGARAQAVQERLDAAGTKLSESEAAWERMRTRNYPRGEARAELRDQVDVARKELDEARAAREQLEEDARAAEIPPGWIELDR